MLTLKKIVAKGPLYDRTAQTLFDFLKNTGFDPEEVEMTLEDENGKEVVLKFTDVGRGQKTNHLTITTPE